ncbi:MAG: DUF1580 domain-containing protein [Phycisphaerales bacterium]|nr:DUF1580 domain-containing protein [Phycisphaerales bacterium]
MHVQTLTDEHITLTAAAKVAPGRPSTNCLWRWCRRGVKARDGQRVRLQHLRIGGKIFTTLRWLEDFGRLLAEADTKYFDLCEAAAKAAADSEPTRQRRRRRQPENPCDDVNEALRELEAAGI